MQIFSSFLPFPLPPHPPPFPFTPPFPLATGLLLLTVFDVCALLSCNFELSFYFQFSWKFEWKLFANGQKKIRKDCMEKTELNGKCFLRWQNKTQGNSFFFSFFLFLFSSSNNKWTVIVHKSIIDKVKETWMFLLKTVPEHEHEVLQIVLFCPMKLRVCCCFVVVVVSVVVASPSLFFKLVQFNWLLCTGFIFLDTVFLRFLFVCLFVSVFLLVLLFGLFIYSWAVSYTHLTLPTRRWV